MDNTFLGIDFKIWNGVNWNAEWVPD
jgi:hypothetical protein